MLFFCLKEFVKGFSWAVVDSTGQPKDGFKKVTLCYRPIYVFALFDKGVYKRGELLQFPICFGNDRHGSTPTTTEVKARLSDPHNQLVWKDQWRVDSAPDEKTKTLRQVSVLLMKKGLYTLEIFWEDGETVENVYRIPVN